MRDITQLSASFKRWPAFTSPDDHHRLEVFESTAEAVILSQSLGEAQPMGDEVIDELVEAFLS